MAQAAPNEQDVHPTSPPPSPPASETQLDRQRLAGIRSQEPARQSYAQTRPTAGHERAQNGILQSTPPAVLKARWSGDDRKSNGSPGLMRGQRRPESSTRSR